MENCHDFGRAAKSMTGINNVLFFFAKAGLQSSVDLRSSSVNYNSNRIY